MRPGGRGGWGNNPRKIPHSGGAAQKPSYNSPWADAVKQEPQRYHGAGILALQGGEDVKSSGAPPRYSLTIGRHYAPTPGMSHVASDRCAAPRWTRADDGHTRSPVHQ